MEKRGLFSWNGSKNIRVAGLLEILFVLCVEATLRTDVFSAVDCEVGFKQAQKSDEYYFKLCIWGLTTVNVMVSVCLWQCWFRISANTTWEKLKSPKWALKLLLISMDSDWICSMFGLLISVIYFCVGVTGNIISVLLQNDRVLSISLLVIYHFLSDSTIKLFDSS